MTGTLSVDKCTFTSPNDFRGYFTNAYDLAPDFFVGEPFDSSTPRFPANQLAIRIQNSGARLEFADALVFWVADSYEVARCVRGRMNADGTQDWNTDLCDRLSTGALGPSNEGRLFVGQETEIVTASFVLNYRCPEAMISADALGSCLGGTCPLPTLCPGFGSWIRFSKFGALPADAATPVSPDYKVNNDERIEASAFHLELCDASTVSAVKDRILPIPPPIITGTLDGSFSFDLKPQFQ